MFGFKITRYQLRIWGGCTVQTPAFSTFLRTYTEEPESPRSCSDADDAKVSASQGMLEWGCGQEGKGTKLWAHPSGKESLELEQDPV